MDGIEIFFTASDQTLLFLYSVALGGALGVFFDLFRAARIIVPHNSFFVGLEDAVFLFVWGLALMLFSYEFARGQVRFYFFLGNLSGFTLYHFTLGNIVVGAVRKIVGFLYKILAGIFGIILKPLRWIFVPIYQILGRFFVGIHSKLKKLWDNAKICLKKPLKMLYNNFTHQKNKEVNKVENGRTKKGKKIRRTIFH